MEDSQSTPLRILVAEDERDILDLYGEILSAAVSPNRFELTLCRQADEAVEVVREAVEKEDPFAVSFLDVLMPPGPDGVWAAEQLRRLDPNIEIVMVTAYSDLSAEEIARRVPPYDKLLYLRKPFFPDEIKHFAIALGSKWQQGRELQGIHHNLEARVRERTGQLVKVNEQLKLEIEERKRADEALRTSEEKYRLLVENQTDLVIKLDAEGRFQYVSPSFCDMFDKTEQDLLGNEFLLLVSQHDREAIAKTMEALYRPPYTCYVEQRVFTRGEWRWVAWGHKALLSADNNAMAIVGVGRDITEHKETEVVLRESQRTLSTLMSNLPGMAYRCFHHHGWVMEFVSDGCLALTGYSPGDLIHNRRISYTELVHPEDRGRVRKEVELALAKDMPFGLTYRITTGWGEQKWVWEQGRGILNADNDVVATEGYIADITDRKQGEEERERLEAQLRQTQKLEAIGNLAGGIAHDFNNLLQAVLGYGELFLLKKDSEEQGLREVQEMVTAARRGAELTRQLLTFSRRVESKKQPLDLNHEVKRVRELLERTMPKMVEIELRLSQDLRAINADPAQIEQMLMNLAVNAEDAMAEGGKLIIETHNATLDEDFCSRHVDAKVGDYGVISVTDTGPGLDDETLERIFEPFFSSKPLGDRPGLGLSMVYGIVKNHDGYIVCDSELGAGTTFKIYLPAMVQEQSVTEVSDVQVPVRGGVETILLVDDEPYLRDLGKQMLESYGYTVFIATDGESALEICRDSAKQIDLVILDLIMPGMGGGRCLQELVKENSPVKVVIASGFSPYDHTREALAGGAKSFIKKPYDMQQMLNVVRETLDED